MRKTLFCVAAVMVALGAIIGARCAIKPKARDSWQVVPNLWGGIVGLPSAKKSPAIGAALKPLDRLIARAMEAHQADRDALEAEKTVFEARKDAIDGRIKTAAKAKDGKGENLDNLARELQPATWWEEPHLSAQEQQCRPTWRKPSLIFPASTLTAENAAIWWGLTPGRWCGF